MTDNPSGISNNNYYDYFPRPNPVKAVKELENAQESHMNAAAQFEAHRDNYRSEYQAYWRKNKRRGVDDKEIECEFGRIFVH